METIASFHLNLSTTSLLITGLSNEIAEWLTTSYKNVVGVGVDVASVDPGSSEEFRVHKTLSQNGIYNIENVNFNLNRTIPGKWVYSTIKELKLCR